MFSAIVTEPIFMFSGCPAHSWHYPSAKHNVPYHNTAGRASCILWAIHRQYLVVVPAGIANILEMNAVPPFRHSEAQHRVVVLCLCYSRLREILTCIVCFDVPSVISEIRTSIWLVHR